MDVKKIRRRAGVSQNQFWTQIGVSQSGGSRFESGEREIPIPVKILLDLAYGTTRERRWALSSIGLHPGVAKNPFPGLW